jgi:ABC-type Fe3+-hydroxamate transport system substrate-binding protein
MMGDIKKRGLDSLISQNSEKESNSEDKEEKYTRTVGFKVTEKQYETYRRYSKYFGTEELIKKWRADIERIEKEKGKDLESIELDIKKRLTK